MKKKSKSHVVQLKERVKERILTKKAEKVGKPEGPSNPSGEEIPADSDVPPSFLSRIERLKSIPKECRCPDCHGFGTCRTSHQEEYSCPTCMGSGQTLPSDAELKDAKLLQAKLERAKLPVNLATFLPVENHGSTNDLARSVISKVKTARPASDLDRLERSQLRGKPKGPSSTRSSE